MNYKITINWVKYLTNKLLITGEEHYGGIYNKINDCVNGDSKYVVLGYQCDNMLIIILENIKKASKSPNYEMLFEEIVAYVLSHEFMHYLLKEQFDLDTSHKYDSVKFKIEFHTNQIKLSNEGRKIYEECT